MLAAWIAGWRARFNVAHTCFESAESAVPPVSGMPELAEPWALLDNKGQVFRRDSRREAESVRGNMDCLWPKDAPHRVVRLAEVEVAEEKPETAPSGLRYRRESGRLMIDGMTMATWPDVLVETADSWPVPPIDREFVARLLEASDAR